MDEQRPDEPDDLTRSEIDLIRQSLRNDWPLAPKVRKAILQALINIVDEEHPTGVLAPVSKRISAARAIAAFARLTLAQQALDLAREKAAAAGDGGGAATAADAIRVVEEIERALGPGGTA